MSESLVQWGPYDAFDGSDPPITDLWFFRPCEIALIAKALAHYAASRPAYSTEGEQALMVWRRLLLQVPQ